MGKKFGLATECNAKLSIKIDDPMFVLRSIFFRLAMMQTA